MPSEATQIQKGDNDDNEDEYAAIITRSRSSEAAGTKFSIKEISKTPKTRKSVRSSVQHRILSMEHSKQQVQQSFHDCVNFTLQLNLTNGRFPTNEQVLSYYFSLNMNNVGVSIAENVCRDVMLH